MVRSRPRELQPARTYLGAQYQGIARFASESPGGQLELGIEGPFKLLTGMLVRDGDVCRMSEEFRDSPEFKLFGYFRFPLMELTKLEMRQRAIDLGVDDVLAMTWFCHTPTRNGRPCRICGPCKLTIRGGLGSRVPLSGRIKHYAEALPGSRAAVGTLRAAAKLRGPGERSRREI